MHRSRLPLTPAMRSVLERMARAGHPPLYALAPDAARAAYAAGADVLEVSRAPVARVAQLAVPVRDGGRIPARLYAPADGTPGVLVYFHGGGFTVGSVDTHDSLCRALAWHSGCAVVSVGYRTAAAPWCR